MGRELRGKKRKWMVGGKKEKNRGWGGVRLEKGVRRVDREQTKREKLKKAR